MYSSRELNRYDYMALNPNESIKLFNFEFDLCVFCPTAKRLLTSQARVGDSIQASLVFYSDDFKDTLIIKGIRRIGSMDVSSNIPQKHSIDPKVSKYTYNLAGRKITPNNNRKELIKTNHIL